MTGMSADFSRDHLLPPEADLKSFARADYHEWGDFIDQPYELGQWGAKEGRAFCQMRRQGNIWAPDGPWPMIIEKEYALGPGPRLEAAYVIKAASEQTVALRFGVELNFSLLAADDPAKRLETSDGQVLRLKKLEQAQGISGLALVNERDGFTIQFKPKPAGFGLVFSR